MFFFNGYGYFLWDNMGHISANNRGHHSNPMHLNFIFPATEIMAIAGDIPTIFRQIHI
jgi:hypothetical protein